MTKIPTSETATNHPSLSAIVEQSEGSPLRLEEQLARVKEKYNDLVWWYARIPDREDAFRPSILLARARIEAIYQKETADLSGENGQFHYGFNSGALAVVTALGNDDLESFDT